MRCHPSEMASRPEHVSLLSVRLQCMGSRHVKSKHITIRFLFCVGLANNESINPIFSFITPWKIQAKTGHGKPLEVKVSKLDNVRRMLTVENPKCCIKSPGQPLEVNRSAASSSKSVSTSFLFLGPFMPQPLSRCLSMSMHCRTIPMIAGSDDKRPLTVPLRILSVTWSGCPCWIFAVMPAANMFARPFISDVQSLTLICKHGSTAVTKKFTPWLDKWCFRTFIQLDHTILWSLEGSYPMMSFIFFTAAR